MQLTEGPAAATRPSVEADARAHNGAPPSGSPRWTLTCTRGADASCAVRLHVPPGLDAAQWTCHTRADHVEVRLRAHVHAAWLRDHDDGASEWSALEGAVPVCSPQVRVRHDSMHTAASNGIPITPCFGSLGLHTVAHTAPFTLRAPRPPVQRR